MNPIHIPQRNNVERKAVLAARRKRQDVRDAKSAIRWQWRSAGPEQRKMWERIYARLVNGEAA